MDNIKFKNKRVLITGGNGYLGGKLAKELFTKGALVISIDIQSNSLCKDVEYFKVDLTDFNQLNDVVHKVAPDLIYHLAATLDRTRDFVLTNKIFQVNVNGTINLLNALKNVVSSNANVFMLPKFVSFENSLGRESPSLTRFACFT